MRSSRRANIFFIVLAVYVMLQFLWWAYLLLSLHADYFHLKQELYLAWGVESNADLALEYSKKRSMILGEGLIFLSLLVVGLVLTARYMSRNAKMVRLQHNFLLSVTHELKTPIASTKLYVQTLQKRTLDPEREADVLERALASNQRLEQLVEKLLLATQIESAGLQLDRALVEVHPIIAGSLETIRSIDGGKHLFNLSCSGGIRVFADPLFLETMVLNLLENASKYAPADTEVAVSCLHEGDQLKISVMSEGTISREDQKHLFEKFYRSGDEETRSAKGTGVGLYLVHSLAKLHGGKVMLHAADGQVEFSILLPAKRT